MKNVPKHLLLDPMLRHKNISIIAPIFLVFFSVCVAAQASQGINSAQYTNLPIGAGGDEYVLVGTNGVTYFGNPPSKNSTTWIDAAAGNIAIGSDLTVAGVSLFTGEVFIFNGLDIGNNNISQIGGGEAVINASGQAFFTSAAIGFPAGAAGAAQGTTVATMPNNTPGHGLAVNGYVGIGTLLPTTNLDVRGDIAVIGTGAVTIGTESINQTAAYTLNSLVTVTTSGTSGCPTGYALTEDANNNISCAALSSAEHTISFATARTYNGSCCSESEFSSVTSACRHYCVDSQGAVSGTAVDMAYATSIVVCKCFP